MAISLFGEMSSTHKHVCCDEDIYDELFGLLSSMRKLYVEKVVNGNMKQARFIELFCDSHHYIGCKLPSCNNVHRMNMGIVRNLYTHEKGMLDMYLYKDSFTKEDFHELIHQHLTTSTESQSQAATSLSFGGKFTYGQLDCLAKIARDNHLFNLSSDTEVRAVMDALLHCKTGFSVKVKNLRNVAVFFDGLLINNLICYNWQSVIEKGRFLISPKTSKSVAASDLSSALYKARTSSTVAKNNIRNDIKQMKKGHTTDM